MKRALLRIKGGFLLILFLFFFGSCTFFSHTHVVDGFTIVHSHPYKHAANGLPLHDHTANGFLLIHFLGTLASLAIIASFLSVITFPDRKNQYHAGIPEGCPSAFDRTSLLRGPPLMAA